MENLTIGEVLGALAIIALIIKYISDGISLWKKPSNEVREQHNKDMNMVNIELDRLEKDKADKKDIDEIKQDITMILKVQLSLLEHSISGNHTTDMVQLKNELQNYIINK